MKSFTNFLLFLLFTNFAISQSEINREVFQVFKEHYNNDRFENIFNDFSTEMQNALSLENAKQFFFSLKKENGIIKSESLVKVESNDAAVYKVDFESQQFSINFSVNENRKINGFIIKPFVEENKATVINGLSDYPNEIAEMIYLNSKNYPNRTQLSIALIENDNVNYYGVVIENDTLKSANNQNKVFEIGSITKVFTSTVLASLVIDKKIKLGNFVNDFYDFSFKDNKKITFLELSNHTSGLPRLPNNFKIINLQNPYKNYKREDLNDFLMNFLSLDTISTKYNYSNLGAGLLGHTLGLSQKQTFVKLLQNKVFDKYGMNNSFTNLDDCKNSIVKGLDKNGNEVSNWEFDVLFGGGGIVSTTEDLAKFAKAQFNTKNKELQLTRNPTFEIDENMKIGLGWHILKSENEFNLIWHNGGTGGYSSSMVLNTKKKSGVIILSNCANSNDSIDHLCFELLKIAKN